MIELRLDLPSAAARRGIAEWHRIVAESDWDRLPDLFTDDITFRSPVGLEPHTGKSTAATILRTVFSIMEDFAYHRHFGRHSGWVLEFTAQVADRPLVGVDVVELDEEGRITDFMVIIRPAAAARALGEEAALRLSAP